VFDASSKVNPGILSLTLRWFGNYDQCLGISEVVGGCVIEGQYCNAIVNPTANLTAYFSQVKKRNVNCNLDAQIVVIQD
jgi:sulfur transfer complex TusBCD TusB component (DsrH family)